jgi:Fur family transcriptional regulator, ferric uptake regulator
VNQSAISSYQGYIERLRKLGVRVTPQRVLVLQALASRDGHMTAEEIMQLVGEQRSGLNLATVYRTLDMLVTLGIVAQTDLGGGASSFELVGNEPHHHLVCEGCHSVTELDDEVLAPLRDQLLARYGFTAHSRHIAVFGLCRKCRLAAEA